MHVGEVFFPFYIYRLFPYYIYLVIASIRHYPGGFVEKDGQASELFVFVFQGFCCKGARFMSFLWFPSPSFSSFFSLLLNWLWDIYHAVLSPLTLHHICLYSIFFYRFDLLSALEFCGMHVCMKDVQKKFRKKRFWKKRECV